ncbi:hypothetical protein [Chitinophaga defluvii]|uniref:Uncharacterized protein n=1 Tax=Chitinophaga defluvii TaxID=3163343 RepID=A0ABV2T448_9BACT
MANFLDQIPLSDENLPEKLTPEMLRGYPGCEHYNDEQAHEIINTIEKLAIILLDVTVPPSNLPENKDEDLLSD